MSESLLPVIERRNGKERRRIMNPLLRRAFATRRSGNDRRGPKLAKANNVSMDDLAKARQQFIDSPRGQQVRQWALNDAADQASAVKQELYKLRDYILRIPLEKERDESLKRFETAYNAFDKLQDFMRSR
jgi:hypothetical protein